MKRLHRKPLTKRERLAEALAKARAQKKAGTTREEKKEFRTIKIRIKTAETRRMYFGHLISGKLAEEENGKLIEQCTKTGITGEALKLPKRMKTKGKRRTGRDMHGYPGGIEMNGMGDGCMQTSRYGRESGLGRRSRLSGYSAAPDDDDDDDDSCASSRQASAKPREETQEEVTQKEGTRQSKKKAPASRLKTDEQDLKDMQRARSIIFGIEETRNDYSYKTILEMKRSMAALKRMIDEYEKIKKIKKE